MIGELVAGFLRQLAISAIDDHAMAVVMNDGPPARFIAMDPRDGIAFAMFVNTGETVRVNRAFRLIMEPLDSVKMRPLCVVHNAWSTS